MDRNIKQSTVLAQLIEEFKKREELGFTKYGTTVDREDFKFLTWTKEMRQELMDALMYLGALENKKMYILTQRNQVVFVFEDYDMALSIARKIATEKDSVRITPIYHDGRIKLSVFVQKEKLDQDEDTIQ